MTSVVTTRRRPCSTKAILCMTIHSIQMNEWSSIPTRFIFFLTQKGKWVWPMGHRWLNPAWKNHHGIECSTYSSPITYFLIYIYLICKGTKVERVSWNPRWETVQWAHKMRRGTQKWCCRICLGRAGPRVLILKGPPKNYLNNSLREFHSGTH